MKKLNNKVCKRFINDIEIYLMKIKKKLKIF